MLIFGEKSSFLEVGILTVQKRELIIEEVHSTTICWWGYSPVMRTGS